MRRDSARAARQPPGIGTGSGPRGGGGRDDGGGDVVVVDDDGGSFLPGGAVAGGAVDAGAGWVEGGVGGALADGRGAGAHSGPPGGRSSGVCCGGTSNPARSVRCCSATIRALASNWARRGSGAAPENASGGTSFTASAMKSCQIIDGRLPPTTWSTPWTLAIDTLARGSPIHTAVDSVGV